MESRPRGPLGLLPDPSSVHYLNSFSREHLNPGQRVAIEWPPKDPDYYCLILGHLAPWVPKDAIRLDPFWSEWPNDEYSAQKVFLAQWDERWDGRLLNVYFPRTVSEALEAKPVRWIDSPGDGAIGVRLCNSSSPDDPADPIWVVNPIDAPPEVRRYLDRVPGHVRPYMVRRYPSR